MGQDMHEAIRIFCDMILSIYLCLKTHKQLIINYLNNLFLLFLSILFLLILQKSVTKIQ